MTIRHIRNREDVYILNGKRDDSRYVSFHSSDIKARAEWVFGGKGFGVGFQLGRNGDESDIGLDVFAGRLGSLWLRLRSPWTKWAKVSDTDKDRHMARHTGVRLWPWESCIVQVQVENRSDTWSRDDPWWRDMKITTTSIVGRTRTITTEGASGDVMVPTPEGFYPANWIEQTYTHKYVRFPGTLIDRIRGLRTHSLIDLSIPGGIPVEGKGENGWDCGMDGLFGCSGSTVDDAVLRATTSVERDRGRYGGPNNLSRPMSVSEAEKVGGVYD